ncbi:glucose 1-dehydrogenase [Candidatus Poribacteria bacterium]|nr:glucose 1-dehydrogenase [Candidatus Poribacteria bacterium]
MVNLENKVAIVTGSSRGIGRGCAIEMAKVGADVVVTYRTHPEEAQEVAEIIRHIGREALVVQLDVADRQAVENLVQATLNKFGKINILVNNAAMTIRKPFLEMPVEDMARVLNVSLWGVFHCSQAVARVMVKQGEGGKIIIISSVHAVIPYANSLPYNTAKAGINNMGYTMATELASYRINVNVIEPGWIDTPGEHKLATEEELKAEGEKLPWGRLGTIEDIGKTAAFLASDAADYITGACFRVDGGFWLPRL